MRKIIVSDYTLRHLDKRKEAPLLFREKTAIAAGIEAFGADVIELAPVKKEREDTIICKTISSMIKNCIVAIPVGATKESIDTAWNCIKDAAHPRLQIKLPVSTVTMEYTYHIKEDKMSEKIASLCSAAAALCKDVEFTAGDASRADRAFLCRAVKTAAEAGATSIVLCDDAEICMPDDIFELVKDVKAICGLPVLVKISNKLGMATALALFALRAGADGVKASISGENSLNTEKFAAMIAVIGDKEGISTNLKTTELKSDISALLKQIHQQKKEDYSKKISENSIYLDVKSSLEDVSRAADALGYSLSEEDDGKVYKALLRVCERKGSVGSKELEAIIASSAMQAPSVYHLESYTATSSNLSTAVANVILKKDEKTVNGVASGDGPIDSAFRAIEQGLGCHYELDDFQIQSVTEGKEALGSALVRLRNGGKLYSGNGLSTDIVGASIRAYLNALNKIISEEE